jgi:hypothetical protein
MKHLLFAAALAALPVSAIANTVDVTLTADTTSIVVGQAVTFTVTSIVHNDTLPAGAFVSSVLPEIGSGDGQHLDAGGFASSVAVTYLSPGTFYPYADVLYFIGNQFGATAGGNGEAIAEGPAITVAAVPEPATWALLLLGFAAIAYRKKTSRSVDNSRRV